MTQALHTQPLPQPDDPNIAQRRATDPDRSVWVSASAGTGKTTVLTARVLRLLLPKHDQPDVVTPPHKILCITYTKAAAAQMVQRVMATAAKWVTLSDDQLTQELLQLYGTPPTFLQFDAARRLFSALVEAPGGLHFMTIHAFCESVLKRFPLEAGLSPHFEVLDEKESKLLLELAARQSLQTVQSNQVENSIKDAFIQLQNLQSENAFSDMIHAAFMGRHKLDLFFTTYPTAQSRYKVICDALQIDPALSVPEIPQSLQVSIHSIIDILKNGSKTDLKTAQKLEQWSGRTEDLGDIIDCFIDSQREIKTPTKTLCKSYPTLETLYRDTAGSLEKLHTLFLNISCAQTTSTTLLCAKYILDRYAQLKQQRACLDFDDLIVKTQSLLQNQMINWVHYKLDGGIDHVLLDEAQDTNQPQWAIIDALTSDFFSGDGRYRDDKRTIFVVGDYKQSIFSFQGADPKSFQSMEPKLSKKVRQSGKMWDVIPLHTSFRSTSPILKLVDCVFNSIHGLALGISPQDAQTHICHRINDPGTVTCWPLITREKENESHEGWLLPQNRSSVDNPEAQLANLIAQDIQSRIDQGPYTAGDFMVLVRRRNSFVDHLIRALKLRNIPTSGADRMTLQSHIAIEDMIVAAKFALQYLDDLSLATLLKSPFIGLSEEALYELTRPSATTSSLWSKAQERLPKEKVAWLEGLITLAPTSGIYDFFAQMLFRSAPADPDGSGYRSILRRLGRDAIDPIEEFLSLCLSSDLEAGMSIQRFIQNFSRNPVTIKRELEKAGSVVRIMTVHASKGLQAPIVYLPDCFGQRAHVHQPKIIWPGVISDLHAPLLMPTNKDKRSAILDDILAAQKKTRNDEILRLLYVALTRAEDHLIVCGAVPSAFDKDDNWHQLVSDALDQFPETKHINTPTGTGKIFEKSGHYSQNHSNKTSSKTQIPTPAWLYQPLQQNQSIKAVINPSRAEAQNDTVLSPLEKKQKNRFTRGLLIHKLLQILPDIEKSNRSVVAQNWLSQSKDIAEQDIPALISEILKVLDHPDFSDLFGPTSRAEVPIVGQRKDGAIISGQVDRLVITADSIKIIDYKTNRPAPMDLAKVPDMYLKQMQAYADLLRAMHPNKTIRAALLWTDGPQLLELPI